MAQQRLAGKDGSVKVGGTTQLGVRQWSAMKVVDSADATGLDSAGWRERKGLLKELRDIRIQCFADAQAGGSPPDNWTNAEATFEISQGTGGKKYTGTMLVETIPLATAHDGIVEYTIQGNSTGEVTEAAA